MTTINFSIVNPGCVCPLFLIGGVNAYILCFHSEIGFFRVPHSHILFSFLWGHCQVEENSGYHVEVTEKFPLITKEMEKIIYTQ